MRLLFDHHKVNKHKDIIMMIDASTTKYYFQLQDLYDRLDAAIVDKTLSMRIQCEFITMLRRIKDVSCQDMAETLNLPLFAVFDIEKGEFPMSSKTFYELSKSLGQPRESLALSRKLKRKIQKSTETLAIQNSSLI